MHPLLRKLEGHDRRSIGRSNEVVAEVIADPALFRALFIGLQSDDPVLRARAADALEKITARHPEYLRPYKSQLIGPLARANQKEVRWHVAQMLPRIRWNPHERQRVLDILMHYMNDESSIVKTFAMQALADLARETPQMIPRVLLRLKALTANGTPAMKARGRKLLARLGGLTRRSTGRVARRRADQAGRQEDR
jgi:hypothetical protein